MIHASTIPVDDGVELLYYRPDSTPFKYRFRRIGIGLTYPESSKTSKGTGYGIAIVLGERCFFPDNPEKSTFERIYVALDEHEDTLSAGMFPALAELKDKYRASTIFCPNTPVSILESLKRYQGVSFYNEKNPAVLRGLFPSFVSTDVRAGISEKSIEGTSFTQDIERVLSTIAIDPDTDEPIRSLDKTHKPMPRLVFPQGMNNVKTSTGVRQRTEEICRALWLVVMGFETSGMWTRRKKEEVTADRGPTGY